MSRLLAAAILAVGIVPLTTVRAEAVPSLTASLITWGVIGLDSNNVNAGPNRFAEGARVCNTGSTAATDVNGSFVWDSANSYVSLTGRNPVSVDSIDAGSCADLYFVVQVQRTSSAYDTARRFHIEVTATGVGAVSTPTPREVYVEKLVSQNRNTIDSVTGPTTVVVGNTYTYVFRSSTAPGGYEQMSTYLNWPNSIFQITDVSATYTAPSGATNDKIYADACGWQPDPSLPNYRTCVGPTNYSGGKAGGTMVTTYTVKVVSAGTASMDGIVYDFSGSSFHYNSDWSATLYSVTAVNSADVSITKSDSPNTVDAGDQVTYTLHVENNGPSTAEAVTVSDPLPPGESFVSADNGGSLSGGTVSWDLGDLAAGASIDLTLVVSIDSGRNADVSNTATVSTSSSDPDSSNDSATEGTTVTTSADLGVQIVDSPDPVGVGETLSYEVDVPNDGPSDARNTTLTETLPAGVTFVSATPTQGTCSELAGVVTCDLGTVVASDTPSVTINVVPTSTGSLVDSATVSSTTTDPVPANNSDTETTTVSPSADLSLTKGDSPDPVVAGNQLTYTLAVHNAGPSTAQGVELTDELPDGTSFVSADTGGSESGGTVTWDLGDLSDGSTVTVHVVVEVDSARTADLSNTATVSSATLDPDSSNDSATQGTTVGANADLSVAISDSPDPVGAGESLTYHLDVANDGPSAAQDVLVTDLIPAGTTFVSAVPSAGSCSEDAGTVECSIGTVGAAGAASIEITVLAPPDAGVVTDTAGITSATDDPNPSNDTDSEPTTVTPQADLSVAISDSTDPVAAGTQLTYTIDVSNAGPSTAAGASAAFTVPPGTSLVSATPSTGLCTGDPVVVCSLGDLASGGAVSIEVVVLVDPARTDPLSATVDVNSSTADPDAANDTDTESTGVGESADISVVLDDDQDPVSADTDLTYTLTVSNGGPADADGVAASFDIPSGTSFVSADAGGTASGTTVSWSVGPLASGASTTLHVTVHVDTGAASPLSANASVSATTPDADSSNNTNVEVTEIAPPGDLGVSIDDGTASVVAGESTTYSVSLTNQGVLAAPAGAVVTVTVPTGTTAVESEPNCEASGSTLICTTTAALALSETVTWQITLEVDASFSSASLTTTASITSASVIDQDPSNDEASDVDAVTAVADLAVILSDGTDPVTAGTELTYSIDVSNNGPSDAEAVVVTQDIPAGTAFVSADSGGSIAGGTVTWNVGGLASGATTTLHLTVFVDPGRTSSLLASATVSSDTADPDHSNDTDTEATEVEQSADIRVAKTADTNDIEPGGTVVYTISVANAGPSDATGVVITDVLPDGLAYVSSEAEQGAYDPEAGEWTIGSLADGDTFTLRMTARVRTSGGFISNVASVTALDQTDPDDGNDVAVKDLRVRNADDPTVVRDAHATADTGRDLMASMFLLLGLMAAGVIALVWAKRRQRGEV